MVIESGKSGQDGQAVIETALMIILLLMLIFGIAEISRAWWLKNQLSNAARVGVRAAVVANSSDLTGANANGSCPYAVGNTIRGAGCGAITGGGLTSLNVKVDDNSTPLEYNNPCNGGTPTGAPGSSVRVCVIGDFTTVVPGLAGILSGPGWSGIDSLIPAGPVPLSASSVMRHE